MCWGCGKWYMAKHQSSFKVEIKLCKRLPCQYQWVSCAPPGPISVYCWLFHSELSGWSSVRTPHTTHHTIAFYTRLKITRKLRNRKQIIPNIAALGRFSNQPSSWKHNLGSNHQYDISVTYLVTPWHRDMTNKSTSHLSLASNLRPYLKCKANSF